MEQEKDTDAALTENTAEKPDYTNEILDIIRSEDSPQALQDKLEDYHENDIAEALDLLTEEEREKLFHIPDITMLASVLEYTDEMQAAEYLNETEVKTAVAIISEMEPDTAVDVLRAIPKEKRTQYLELMDDDARKDVKLIASFDEDEIGSKMTTNFIVIKKTLSVKEAMNALVEQAAENDNISTLFVTNESDEFCGAIDLKELIIARKGTALDDLIVTSFPHVYANESVDDCIEELKNYSEDSIPVLNNDNRLIGVITAQSLLEVVDEEMGEDYAKLAGLTAEEDLTESLGASMKKRLPWLTILLALGLVVSTVIGLFEHVVAELTMIVAFQSLILDMAGNVGTQSLAVTIRVLTDESLTSKQKFGLVTKEMRTGFCNGLVLGSLSFLFVGLYIFLFKGKTFLFSAAVSGCIGISLLVAMLVSSAVGTLIPLFFKKIKVDPAVASGPLITTINDLVAVVIYYGLSWLFLLNILHLVG